MRKLLLLLFIFIFTSAISNAQILQYGVGFGKTFVLGPDYYTGNIDTAGTGLDLSSNYHLGGKIKMKFTPNSPLTFAGFLYYTTFGGSEDNIVIGSNTAVDLETSSSLWTLGLGGEYHFYPEETSPVSPYINLVLQFNSQGNTKFDRVSGNRKESIEIDGKTRVGMGLGGGIDFKLLPQLVIDTNMGFNFINLFGQEDGEDGFNTFAITINLLYSPYRYIRR